MANPIVIDLSHWQPDPINWSKVMSGGTVGVIHKATEGTGYTDPALFQRGREAMLEGLCWSTYHFLHHGRAGDQAAFYLATIDPVKGERVCIDYEDMALSLGDLKEFVEYVRWNRPDLQITVYGASLLTDHVNAASDVSWLADTSLWAARYSSNEPVIGKAWKTWSLWQNTDKASVAGIDGPVDGNIWNGSVDGLRRWFGPIGADPVPEPDVPKDISISCAPGTVFNINGVEVIAR